VVVHYPHFDWSRSEDKPYKSLCCIKAAITPQGIVGSHLNLQKREFQGKLEERPHMHWSWNQLVQPNNGGNWEGAQVAILEPLSAFENSVNNKPVGVAPYDTLTFHSHHLSDQSILLVPSSILEEARAYLTEFTPGRIMPFNGDIRSAIIEALHNHYPQTWHICDEKGNLIGKKMKHSAGGYDQKTCLRTTDGRVIELIEGRGHDPNSEHKSRAIKEYHKVGRYIGLHADAATNSLEKNVYFKELVDF